MGTPRNTVPARLPAHLTGIRRLARSPIPSPADGPIPSPADGRAVVGGDPMRCRASGPGRELPALSPAVAVVPAEARRAPHGHHGAAHRIHAGHRAGRVTGPGVGDRGRDPVCPELDPGQSVDSSIGGIGRHRLGEHPARDGRRAVVVVARAGEPDRPFALPRGSESMLLRDRAELAIGVGAADVDTEFLELPCLALIVFGWPTGRPSHRLRGAVIVYAVTVAAIFQIGAVFRKSLEPSAQWPDAWQAVFSLPQVWYLMDGFQALALNAVPAIATIIWLVRRRRAVPPAVRPLISPITVAGVLVASSLVLVHFGFQVFGSLFGGDDTDISAARLLVLVADYFHAGFVAIGVLIAATRRRRAIAVGTRQMLVDLRSATPVVSPSAAAAAIVGDPSASVRYRGPGGGWIDSEGTALGDVGSDRRLLPVVDGAGEVTAGLEVDASTPVPPLLADLAVSAIAARAANERATALADARRRDVRARSRALVAATDAGRITLERNLHDGAQQLLVGLALTAGLRVRQFVLRDGPREAGHPDPIPNEDAPDILDEIDRVRREVLDLVDSTAPAVLATGLAGALRSVAAISPIATTLDVAGDLPPDDPLTLGLYLAAGEAMTNAVKHSGQRTCSFRWLLSTTGCGWCCGTTGSAVSHSYPRASRAGSPVWTAEQRSKARAGREQSCGSRSCARGSVVASHEPTRHRVHCGVGRRYPRDGGRLGHPVDDGGGRRRGRGPGRLRHTDRSERAGAVYRAAPPTS